MNLRSKYILLLLLFHIPVAGLYAQQTQDFYEPGMIQNIRITFDDPNWESILDSLFQTGDGKTRLEAEVTINGHKYRDAGVRYKGFSSWDADYKKNPFSIYLDHKIKGQNYQGYTTIKLGNVIHDPSFVRELLSYEIAGKYMPASKANYALLYINNVFTGLYTNVESVDDHFLVDHFGSSENSFFKGSPQNLEYPFGQNANLAYTHGADTTGYMPYYECESGRGWADLLRLIYILNNDTANLATVLNIDRTLWMHAFNYTLVNLDSYIGYSQNYYLYLDDQGVFNPVVWDLNMSFGSFRHTDGTALNLTIPKVKQLDPLRHLTGSTYSPRPLTKNLFLNSTLRKMYLAHIRTIVDENFKNNFYLIRAAGLQQLIDSAVQCDTNKFYSYSDFLSNVSVTTGPFSDQYPGIMDLMESRIVFLDSFPGYAGEPEIMQPVHLPEVPGKGELCCISAKVTGADQVWLGYRHQSKTIFSKQQMFDDGNHNDGLPGDSIFATSVTAPGNVLQYYIWAENDSAGVFSPERAENEFYTVQPLIGKGDVVINEFMACNQRNITDQDSEPDPWIELLNNTREKLNLSGLSLCAGADANQCWAFPDTVIDPGGFLIVWADGQTAQYGLHTGFRPNDAEGSILLRNVRDEIIDSVVYAGVPGVRSTGRYPNGRGPFIFMQPSFARNNHAGNLNPDDFCLYPNPTTGRVFIELMADYFPLTIEVLDSKGCIVFSEDIVSGSLADATGRSVDLTGMNSGVYVARLKCKDQCMSKKIIIY